VQFPKGRIDSLTNHLVKKCPALPLRDRQRALLQVHDLHDLPDLAHPASAPMQSAQTMSLPFTPSKQGLSALETLAEVSRQHLDLSGKRVSAKQSKTPPVQQQQQQQQQQQSTHNGNSQGALFDEFLTHDDRPDSDMSAMSQALDMSHAPALPSIYQFNGPLHHSPTGSPHIGSMPLTSSASMAQMVPSLVMAASQANELMPLANGGLTMEPELNLTHPGISDRFFQAQARQWPSSIDPLLPDHTNKPPIAPKENTVEATPPRPIAMNPSGTQAHFTTDFSVNQKPAKPKVRGRFSDTRRKEVQEVRKRGACIRCRMLKKPCSGDNPCNTCQNVESARLWKQPCIRTRIAEEFNLYSAGLHGVLAFHAISQAKNQVHLEQIPGRIEATHFPDSGIVATFTPLTYQITAHTDIDPAIMAVISPSQLEIIDNEDDISGKLDLYVKKISQSFFESEDSSFMKTTLNVASRIGSPNQDGLLHKALELWNLTRILTSPAAEWHLFSNPSLAPTMTPPTITPSDLETINRTPITSVNNSSSYELIKMQLMGATEKRAACLARIVMNDLERRLLQRQQANPFETFLVAVVLLACVERMCWLFRSWEDQNTLSTAQPQIEAPKPDTPTTDDTLAQALQSVTPDTVQQSSRNPKWPFDKHPAYYSQQGERFSDILFMLLKMRGVPPKPKARYTDGVLVIYSGEGDEKAREWYEGIGVTSELLTERREARFVGEDPKEWELKYVGKIISGL